MVNERQKNKRRIDKKLIFYCSFMALPVIQFVIFYIGVNLQSFAFAFQKYDSFNRKFYFDWSDLFVNFKDLWTELHLTNNLTMALKNSLIVWFTSSLIGTVIAVFFSYYIFKHKKSGRFFRFVLFIPSILPAILLSIVFRLFVNDVLPLVFHTADLMDKYNPNFATIVFYTVWIGFGTQILLYTGAMEQISTSVIEAGEMDGASPMVELFKIVLPEVIPTIGTFLVAGIAGAFINQANLFNFFGHGAVPRVQTVGYYMFKIVTQERGEVNYNFASTIGLCCTLIAVPPTLLLRKVFDKYED